jgi:hypothetical protein
MSSGHTPIGDAAVAMPSGRAAVSDAAVAMPDPHAAAADAAVAGLDAAATAAPGSAHAMTGVTAHAFAMLTRGDYAQLSAELMSLDRAAAQDPPDAYAMFYSGAFRLWKAAQGTTGLGDVLGLPSLADEWISRLTSARALLPDDFRVTGFLCNAQIAVGTLRADAALVQRGLQTCDAAMVQAPAYGHFLKATATSALPIDDPNFKTSFDDMLALANLCQFPTGDAQHSYRYPVDPARAPDPGVCLDEGIVPHCFEGIFIVFGDIALKAKGDAELARALYRSAQTAPNYTFWPYAPDLEQRIEQADDRAARFHDADPFNDPDMWSTKICVGCHQERVTP